MDTSKLKTRLDQELVDRELVRSRSEAKDYIERGLVKVNGFIVSKSSFSVSKNDILKIEQYKNLVSRAGEKMLEAIEKFSIQVKDRQCLDIGSSTGGFTQVLLENGASSVVAVDVGNGQFNKNLYEKYKDQILLFENTDIRDYAKSTNLKFDIIVCDISFISLDKIIDSILNVSKLGTEYVILLKPQFEVGRENINKGIVKDVVLYDEIIEKYKKIFTERNIKIEYIIDSPILGGSGNKEFLIYAKLS